MFRSVLIFSKQGNIRFISHLDTMALIKRAIRRADIDIAFSNGYNPHELCNIVSPLSLGYTGSREFFEIDTLSRHDPEELTETLNAFLPQGLKFTGHIEDPIGKGSLSAAVRSALYKAILPVCSLDVSGFILQDSIMIKKRDKKTKKEIDADVSEGIVFIDEPAERGDGYMELKMCIGSGNVMNVNPTNLLKALYAFSGQEYPEYEARIERYGFFADINGEYIEL